MESRTVIVACIAVLQQNTFAVPEPIDVVKGLLDFTAAMALSV